MMTEGAGPAARKRLAEHIPKPVRIPFRWMNFHFSENGRAICDFAKTLPEDQRKAVIENGKDLTTARSKKNLPRGVRNVAASLVVGQGMWYFACPALHGIDAIRNSPLDWPLAGGLDKLFLSPENPFFTTGGASHQFAQGAAAAYGGSRLIGALTLAGELATDFSRCFIEYWTQKRFGVMADGAARAYGQVRPFPVRYSSLEAYQKMIGYALNPTAIGTPKQIFSSVYGILGSIWRTGPQLAIVCTVGRAVDFLFKKIAEWTRLAKLAKRIYEEAAEREQKAFAAIRGIVGEERFTALKVRIAAESKTMWKWNPFKPAVSMKEAEDAAHVIADFNALQARITTNPIGDDNIPGHLSFIHEMGVCAGALFRALGTRKLAKYAPAYSNYLDLSENRPEDLSNSEWRTRLSVAFGNVATELQTERELR
jgi:hypothetical protein